MTNLEHFTVYCMGGWNGGDGFELEVGGPFGDGHQLSAFPGLIGKNSGPGLHGSLDYVTGIHAPEVTATSFDLPPPPFPKILPNHSVILNNDISSNQEIS